MSILSTRSFSAAVPPPSQEPSLLRLGMLFAKMTDAVPVTSARAQAAVVLMHSSLVLCGGHPGNWQFVGRQPWCCKVPICSSSVGVVLFFVFYFVCSASMAARGLFEPQDTYLLAPSLATLHPSMSTQSLAFWVSWLLLVLLFSPSYFSLFSIKTDTTDIASSQKARVRIGHCFQQWFFNSYRLKPVSSMKLLTCVIRPPSTGVHIPIPPPPHTTVIIDTKKTDSRHG